MILQKMLTNMVVAVFLRNRESRNSKQMLKPTPTHLYIQVHLNKLECREKVHFFLQVISKSETFIYFRFIACKVKHFKKNVLILMIRAYSS